MKALLAILFVATALNGGLKCAGNMPPVDGSGELDNGYTLTLKIFRCPTTSFYSTEIFGATKQYLSQLRNNIPDDFNVPACFPAGGSHTTLRQSLSFIYGPDLAMADGEAFVKKLIFEDSNFRDAVTIWGYDGENIGSIIWTQNTPSVISAFFQAISDNISGDPSLLLGEELSESGYKMTRNVICLAVEGPAEELGNTWFGMTSVGRTRGIMLINTKAVALADIDNYLSILIDNNRISLASQNENSVNIFVAGTEVHELGHLLTQQNYEHGSATQACALSSFGQGLFIHNNFCRRSSGTYDHWGKVQENVVFNDGQLEER